MNESSGRSGRVLAERRPAAESRTDTDVTTVARAAASVHAPDATALAPTNGNGHRAQRHDAIGSGGLRDGLRPRIADEAEYVVGAFRERPGGGKQITVVAANGGIDHMYAEGELLLREEHLDRVLGLLEQPARQDLDKHEPDRIQPVTGGFVRLTLGDPHPTVAGALDLVDRRFGRGTATPNHVLTVCGDGEMTVCPATEPEQVDYDIEPFPAVSPDAGAGAGVRVYVSDTGLLRDAAEGHAWLEGIELRDSEHDYDPPKPLEGDPPVILPYTGHGTFVAGVLRCIAPATDVVMTNAFAVAGSELESDLVPRLDTAFRLGVDIFHLGFAGPSRYDIPLAALGEWLKRLSASKGAICLAPAGNSARRRPVWPAAFPEVISVGALDASGRSRASFSSFGPWVDVYAPGRDLVNAYATGTYTCYVSPYIGQVRNFYGMARWSGTSFSTPIVSGLIAARMSRTGENARQAAEALLAEARARAIPGIGPVLVPQS
jgi:subtilisin family serine protease